MKRNALSKRASHLQWSQCRGNRPVCLRLSMNRVNADFSRALVVVPNRSDQANRSVPKVNTKAATTRDNGGGACPKRVRLPDSALN